MSRWLGLALLILSLSVAFFQIKGLGYELDGGKVKVGQVVHQGFIEAIPASGQVEPILSIQVNAAEGGRVEEIWAEEGQFVEKGTPLLRLSNTSLSLDFMNRETQIIEQVNNLRNTRISLLQNQRQSEDVLIAVENEFSITQRKYASDSLLASQKAISDISWFNSQMSYRLSTKKYALAKKRAVEDETYRRKQIGRIDASIDLMHRNLEAIRANLEQLVVKAPASGQLNSFSHELGSQFQKGQNLGRIDDLASFKVKAQIDQYYLSRISNGQKASFEFGRQPYVMSISKVSSTVANGQFEIELLFGNEKPPQLIRGQQFQMQLSMSAATQSLQVPKGAFYQSTGGQWVYVLDDAGKAYKRSVRFGRQNLGFIEVLDGLEKNEKILLSSYDSFKEYDEIIIIN